VALVDALAARVEPADEAMVMERLDHAPRLVEGGEDNLKITAAPTSTTPCPA
jgi:2-C-methyl-D-erythritol 4-phosphate cytidylyltransferase